MYNPVVVKVGRTNVIGVSFEGDISGEVWASEIRKGRSISSELIATWDVAFATDGTDGNLVLTLDDAVTAAIQHTTGWMDVKRVANGEPFSAFVEPIPVIFEGVVTA